MIVKRCKINLTIKSFDFLIDFGVAIDSETKGKRKKKNTI